MKDKFEDKIWRLNIEDKYGGKTIRIVYTNKTEHFSRLRISKKMSVKSHFNGF